MPDRERLLFRIDIAYHRLVSAEHDSRIHVDIAALVQHGRRLVRQELHEVLVRLRNKRSPVGKEQHVLYPIVALEHIHKRYGHARLARTGRHDQEPLAVHGVVMLAHRLDGHFLVVAVRDVGVHAKVRNVLAVALLNQAFQIFAGMESKNPARRITQPVNDIRLETVGVVDDRAATIVGLQTVGIEFRLVLALDG